MIVLPSVCYEEANTLANLGHPYAVLGKHRQARIAWQQALARYLYLAQHRNDDAAGIEHRLADHRQDWCMRCVLSAEAEVNPARPRALVTGDSTGTSKAPIDGGSRPDRLVDGGRRPCARTSATHTATGDREDDLGCGRVEGPVVAVGKRDQGEPEELAARYEQQHDRVPRPGGRPALPWR